MKLGTLAAGVVAACATVLAGCVTTSMQGYADLDRPARPVEHIAVVAPPALVAVLAAESSKRGLIIEDGNVIVPPTRQYMVSRRAWRALRPSCAPSCAFALMTVSASLPI